MGVLDRVMDEDDEAAPARRAGAVTADSGVVGERKEGGIGG